MPSFTVTPIASCDPPVSQVRLDLDMSDMTNVTRAVILRYNETDGTSAAVRPFDIDMTAGPVVIYDTEFPLDTPVHYVAYPQSVFDGYKGIGGVLAATARPAVIDTFTRVVADDWGASDNGHDYDIISGVVTGFSVNGTQGVTAVPTAGGNSQHVAARSSFTGLKNSFGQITCVLPALATGATYSAAMSTRVTDGSNYIRFSITLDTDALTNITITAVIGGSSTTIANVNNVFAYAAGNTLNFKYIVVDNQLYFKSWIGAEPADWQLAVANSTGLSLSGGVGVRAAVSTGSTNTLPLTLLWDSLTATFLDTYDTVTMSSVQCGQPGGWIRDPLNPCNDLRMTLLPEGDCPVSEGVIPLTQDTETFTADAARFWVQGRRRPVVVSDIRKDAVGRFVFATVSFTDRDALLDLLEPDDVLFFQFPPEFGIADRYYDIGDVQVSHIVTDLRVQWRLFDLPYAIVDQPSAAGDAGQPAGVCGTRWMDMCAPNTAWTTWDQADASGLTIQQVLQGEAAI